MTATESDNQSALFVYGSLLDEAHRTALLGRAFACAPARLAGYERRRGRYFYIVARAGAEVVGVMLNGLGERDFTVLDRYEEVARLYTRVKIEVAAVGGVALRCWVYLPTPALLAAET